MAGRSKKKIGVSKFIKSLFLRISVGFGALMAAWGGTIAVMEDIEKKFSSTKHIYEDLIYVGDTLKYLATCKYVSGNRIYTCGDLEDIFSAERVNGDAK
ncbi:hypothetical protein [Prosthecomicrobium hirschii]|uniref:hypothetical protein n=1 Tax=Prosthecodimorpha hirschii TaxID=665126 RepID=UPI00128F30D0|nr:hypothetical protein [Prosthecomicrobium hirschii]